MRLAEPILVASRRFPGCFHKLPASACWWSASDHPEAIIELTNIRDLLPVKPDENPALAETCLATKRARNLTAVTAYLAECEAEKALIAMLEAEIRNPFPPFITHMGGG